MPSAGSSSVAFAVTVRHPQLGEMTRVLRQLTQVDNLAAVTEGTFFYEAAGQRVYVWLQGGGSPSGRVELRAPGTVHDGIGFVRVDGSEVRLLAHTYQLYRAGQYWQLPRATVSADGGQVNHTARVQEPLLTVRLVTRVLDRIPRELFEAARLEGLSELAVWRRVAWPLGKPAAFAVAVLAFVFHWSNFVEAVLYISARELYTIPLGLRLLHTLEPALLSLLLTGAVIASVPPVVAFLAAQRALFTRTLEGR